MSELRWHPLLGEWVITATTRQDRTFLPPADFCPLDPTRPGHPPTEIPEPDFEIAVFQNRFPSLRPNPPTPAVLGTELTPVRPAVGECEVVVYTPRHTGSLASESVEHIRRLIQVWTDRTEELSAREEIRYVFIFENKGEPVGVTLHHPHGQIYAYPYIPPRILRELEQSLLHFEKARRCLVCDVVEQERTQGRRLVAENARFTAFVPFFARWPYEVHIVPLRHLQGLPELTAEDRTDFAALLKTVLVAYDRLFDMSFPYMMVLHQGPCDAGDHGHYHFHVEFYPPVRAANRLKYLASSETGAGAFINDTLAEEKAAELRAHVPGAFKPR